MIFAVNSHTVRLGAQVGRGFQADYESAEKPWSYCDVPGGDVSMTS